MGRKISDNLEICDIKIETKTIFFNKPIVFKIDKIEEMLTLNNEELGIFAYGKNKELAIKNLNLKFYYIISEILKEKDENLDKNSIEFKNKLRSLIKNIENI